MADISSLQVPRDEHAVPSDEMEIASDAGRNADNYMSDIELDFDDEQPLPDAQDSMIEDLEDKENDDDDMQYEEALHEGEETVEEDIVLEDGYDVEDHGPVDIELPEIKIDETVRDNSIQPIEPGTIPEADSANMGSLYTAETFETLAPPLIIPEEPATLHLPAPEVLQAEEQKVLDTHVTPSETTKAEPDQEVNQHSIDNDPSLEDPFIPDNQGSDPHIHDQLANNQETENVANQAIQDTTEHTVAEDTGEQAHDLNESSQTQPIILVYEGNEYYLFECGDASKDYFIEDRNKVDSPLKDIINECKHLLGDDLNEDHYVSFGVECMDLLVSENTHEISSVTLYDILEIYFLLCHNDGIANPDPLRITLNKIPKLSTHLTLLRGYASDGKGLQYLEGLRTIPNIEDPNDDGPEDEENPEDYNEAEADETHHPAVNEPEHETQTNVTGATEAEDYDDNHNDSTGDGSGQAGNTEEGKTNEEGLYEISDEVNNITNKSDVTQDESQNLPTEETDQAKVTRNHIESADSSVTVDTEGDIDPPPTTDKANGSEQDEGENHSGGAATFEGDTFPTDAADGTHEAIEANEPNTGEVEETHDVYDEDDAEETPTEADVERQYDDRGPTEDDAQFELTDEQLDQYVDSGETENQALDEGDFETAQNTHEDPAIEQEPEDENDDFHEFDFGSDDGLDDDADEDAEIDQFLSFADNESGDTGAANSPPRVVDDADIVSASKRKRPRSEVVGSADPAASPKRPKR